MAGNEQSTFLQRVLDPPRYGFTQSDGTFYAPTQGEIWGEFFRRLNLFQSRHNWLPFFSWAMTCALVVPFVAFFAFYFSWPLLGLGLFYSMVVLGSHGTFWLHRFGTHRAFRFSHPWVRTICRNLVLRIIPEEVYIVSHHVHHRYSEQPGDPYNVHGGWLYCFLADANHQGLSKNLTERDYAQALTLMAHTGVKLNSYEQYRRWGSLSHPGWSLAHYLANWGFWFAVWYSLGGMALATALFGLSGVWAFGVRTYNYDGHGRGVDKRKPGVDFNRDDFSVNQIWPGYVAGEWHNNHHLYPNGARSGFLPYQLDLPWIFISLLSRIGAVSSFRDYKKDFLRDHLAPYLARQKSLEREQNLAIAKSELERTNEIQRSP